MDAIKRRISGESEPINLISDALTRGQPARTDGDAGKISTPGLSACVRLSAPPPPFFHQLQTFRRAQTHA